MSGRQLFNSINMKTQIVIGLGYGDEGKGLTTDYLCRQANKPLVLRFSGGQQAGHTVVTEAGQRHIFSSLGAGSLAGAPTYWSRFCAFAPENWWNEYQALTKKLGQVPAMYVDALAQVTTPYDVYHNRSSEKNNAHGSCGMGFGATMERNETTPYRLYVQDLFYPSVLEQKLTAIGDYYRRKVFNPLLPQDLKLALDAFKAAVTQILPLIEVVQESIFFEKKIQQLGFDALIFEGSQGILLDRDFGFFPNVTRAYTTSRNAMELITTYQLPQPEIFYISRAYQTRHGIGFMSNEDLELNYIPNPLETNVYNEWQGHLRAAPLDLDLLQYALDSDRNFSGTASKNLVITCLDQLTGNLTATAGGALRVFETPEVMAGHLNTAWKGLYFCYGDKATALQSRTSIASYDN
jgi:adenylosuccinate synthase